MALSLFLVSPCPSLLQVAQQDWPMPTLPTLTTSPSLAVPTLPRTASPTVLGVGLRLTEALYLLTGMLLLLTWTTSSALLKLNKVLIKHTPQKSNPTHCDVWCDVQHHTSFRRLDLIGSPYFMNFRIICSVGLYCSELLCLFFVVLL